MEAITLCNDELESSLFENVRYFMFAEGGAMGTPGDMHILTADCRHYQMNYVYGDINLKKLEKVFPVFRKFDFGLFGSGSVPAGWEYVYLGAGNHLAVEESVFEEFAAIVKDFDNPGYVFQNWYRAAVKTLNGKKQVIWQKKHQIVEYITNGDNSVRYVLGKYTENPLVVFGINPSHASAEENDKTISIVEKIAQMWGKDGYIMLNIYPERAKKIQKDFSKDEDSFVVKQNLKYITERIKTGDEVVAAWGDHIRDRGYFLKSLIGINEIIKDKSAKWVCLKETQEGHPHHPLWVKYKEMEKPTPFDMDSYIAKMSRKSGIADM